MGTTVGIMGFGRIGRNLFRLLYRRDDIRIGGISDVAEAPALEYLLRFDTLFGRFPDEVSVREGSLFVLGRQIPMMAGEEKGAIPPWGALGVDTVIEATARKLDRADLQRHLDAGARRVIHCALPTDRLDFTVVPGLNDDALSPSHRILSAASPTLHCLAPVVRILLDAFGIEKLIFTAIHSYTREHRLADVPAEDKRRGRSAPENIIPQDSRSASLLMELIPPLSGRVLGSAMNVPVPNGSALDLVAWHTRKVTPAAIGEVMRTAAASRWKGILAYEPEPIVSSDIATSTFSGTYDALATMVLGEKLSKTLFWYDEAWGYAHRIVELVERFEVLEGRWAAAVAAR